MFVIHKIHRYIRQWKIKRNVGKVLIHDIFSTVMLHIEQSQCQRCVWELCKEARVVTAMIIIIIIIIEMNLDRSAK